MIKLTHGFLGAMLVFGVSYHSLALVESEPVTEDILVVASGGYNSCGDSNNPYGIGMYGHVEQLLTKLGTTYKEGKLKYIVNCLTTARPPQGTGRYITSKDPQKIIAGNAYDLLEEIKSLADENTPIIIAGHSYGGWLSMFLTLELGDEYNLQGLFTIDPISPKACGPIEVILGSAGCHQAPRDLDNQKIVEISAYWANFYQTDDRWLNSSEIEDADKNYHIVYPDSHTNIDSDDRVWDRIINQVVSAGKSLKRSLQISQMF